MSRTQEEVPRAVGKWIAGIAATVLGGVLTVVIVNTLDDNAPPPPPDPNSTSPSMSPSPQPAWERSLTTDQLRSVLLGRSDRLPGYTSDAGPPGTETVTRCYGDAAEKVLGSKGRTGGKIGITLKLSHEGTQSTARGTLPIDLVREDLASYASAQDAADTIRGLAEWIDECNYITGLPGRYGPGTIRVTEWGVTHYGDETKAANVWLQYTVSPATEFTPARYDSHYSTVVVVQLRLTVCVLRFESAVSGTSDPDAGPPHPDDVNRYIAAAIDKLKTVK